MHTWIQHTWIQHTWIHGLSFSKHYLIAALKVDMKLNTWASFHKHISSLTNENTGKILRSTKHLLHDGPKEGHILPTIACVDLYWDMLAMHQIHQTFFRLYWKNPRHCCAAHLWPQRVRTQPPNVGGDVKKQPTHLAKKNTSNPQCMYRVSPKLIIISVSLLNTFYHKPLSHTPMIDSTHY